MTRDVHDRLAKEVFSRLEDARTLFRAFLAERYLCALDLDGLSLVRGSFVDRRFRDRHSDLVFSVPSPDGEVLIYLLFEHKSYQDRWLVLQLFLYVGRIWARYRREHGQDCWLPLILPVVLYHGEGRWNRPLRLVDLCGQGGPSAGRLEPSQPTLPLTLIDLSQIAEKELERTLSRGTALATLTVLLMKSIRGTRLLERLRCWLPIVRRARAETGGRQMLELLVNYVLLAARQEVDVDELEVVLSDAIGPEAEELVMNTGEKLIQKGEERGVKKGMAQALANVLRKRFGEVPETVQARMDAADLETLQLWHDRAIVAESVDEVFGA